MAIEVVMPRLGWTMETGKLAEWLKKDGDTIQAGDVIFTVESDKAVQEVEAMDSGILRIPPGSLSPGIEAPVGEVLAYLVQPGEPAPFEQQGRAEPGAPLDQDDVTETAPPPASPEGVGSPPRGATAGEPQLTVLGAVPVEQPARRDAPSISPRALRVAQELGVDWSGITGSGRTGRIVERDVRAIAARAAPAGQARITPLARRLAQDNGISLEDLAARKSGQRIGRDDVAAAAATAPTTPGGAGASRAQPIGNIRRIIAERMAQSAHTVAPVTLTTEADATELARLRERIKAALAGSERRAPSYNDLLARLVALALLEHPWMNCSWSDDGIVQHDAVHLGFAVDTDKGLVAPVVRDAHLKSLQQITEESACLVEQTRASKVAPGALQGSTFTITNLGMYDIDAFTPIINLPDCAILGVGRIVARPVVIDEEAGEIAVRKMITLSLTFDHRLVDGAPAARFLQHIKRWVEQPYGWLAM